MSDTSTSRYPVPTIRLFVRNEHGKILILKRAADSYGGGAWCLPGGKVDYGETVEQTVAKELREETSLESQSARFCFYQDSLPYNPGEMHVINLYFECDVSGEISLNQESSEVAWIGPEDLEYYDITFRNEEGLRRYWPTATTGRRETR